MSSTIYTCQCTQYRQISEQLTEGVVGGTVGSPTHGIVLFHSMNLVGYSFLLKKTIYISKQTIYVSNQTIYISKQTIYISCRGTSPYDPLPYTLASLAMAHNTDK